MMELALYVPDSPSTEEERAHRDKNMQLVLDVVTGEDFPAACTIQIGLASGAQTQVVYGRNEPAMIHYNQSMRDALRGDASSERLEVTAAAHHVPRTLCQRRSHPLVMPARLSSVSAIAHGAPAPSLGAALINE
jgi:hypothetical protein